MKLLSDIPNRGVYKFGMAYIISITVIGAIANYFTWHRQFSSAVIETTLFIFEIIIWIALYVPMYVFMRRDAWKIEDFGFAANKRLTVVSVILVLLIIIRLKADFSFNHMIFFEAFARTGEELFYRGYIYGLVIKLSKRKENSWKWAVLISSFFFAIMHTQTFLPGNPLSMPDIFITALILGLFRHWTASILPGIIIHCATNGGILCMFIGILIYLVVLAASLFFGKRSGPAYKEASIEKKD